MTGLRESFSETFEHIWTHRFTQGEGLAERQAWLDEVKAMMQAADIAFIHRETEDGFELAFYDEAHWQAFALNFTAKDRGGETHRHTHRFVDPAIQDAWTQLACSYLDAAGIAYEIETKEGMSRFTFAQLSDRIALNHLIDSGLLDEGAEMICRMRAFGDYTAGHGGPRFTA